MIFIIDVAFALYLVALGVGIAFLIWVLRSEGAGTTLAKAFGYIIAITAVVGLLCTTYYGVKYWEEGYFYKPAAAMNMRATGNLGGMEQNQMSGMSGGAMECPCMKMMKEKSMQDQGMIMKQPMNQMSKDIPAHH